MANQLSPPPVRTPFAGKDPSGSGVSWPWLKWFQDIFTQIGTVLVVSVFGRTGAVTPQAGDYPPNLGGTGQTAWNKGNLLVGTGPNSTDLKPVGAAGSVLTADPTTADGVNWIAPGASATTNLTMPAEFTVTGSGPGTIVVTKAAESPNTFWRGPTSGGSSPPTFGPLIPADFTGVQRQSYNFGVDVGAANAYAVVLSPVVTAYTTGLKVAFLAVNANGGGASTLAVNGLAAKAIKKWVGGALVALVAGDISAGQYVETTYDGTQFQYKP